MDSYLLAANNILFKATLAPSFISSDTDGSAGYSRESVVVGGITATIFLLCCLTIAFTLNYSKDVDKCETNMIIIMRLWCSRLACLAARNCPFT